ncbi:MAG: hypothetical protein QOD75_3312 [Blastocatellia bacterium]|jgi:uncharacterized protein (TIGR02246 family)|nr:hypothetical protein [Blastocatellia bacterium]
MPNDEQLIREVIDNWMRATAAGNVSQILELMDEDAVFLVQGQPPMRGRAAFAAGLEKALEKFAIESTSDIQEVEVAGELAYCWNQLTVTMTPKAEGSPIKRSGYTLTIFRKDKEGKWVLFRDANLLA